MFSDIPSDYLLSVIQLKLHHSHFQFFITENSIVSNLRCWQTYESEKLMQCSWDAIVRAKVYPVDVLGTIYIATNTTVAIDLQDIANYNELYTIKVQNEKTTLTLLG